MTPPIIFAMLCLPFSNLFICFPKKNPNIQITNVIPVITRASQTINISNVASVIPTVKASIEVATPWKITSSHVETLVCLRLIEK